MLLKEGDKIILETSEYSDIIDYFINQRTELGIVIYSKDEWNCDNPSEQVDLDDENLIIIANSQGYTHFIDGCIDIDVIKRILVKLGLDSVFSI